MSAIALILENEQSSFRVMCRKRRCYLCIKE